MILSAFSDSGYGDTASRGVYDGLGANLSGDGKTLHIQINHETSGAAISRLDVDVAKVRLAIASTIDNGSTTFPSSITTGMGYAYDSIFDGTYDAVANSTPVASGDRSRWQLRQFQLQPVLFWYVVQSEFVWCQSWLRRPDLHDGEEVSGGKMYALDQVTRQLWEVPDIGTGVWENAALVDTGNASHVALVLSRM